MRDLIIPKATRLNRDSMAMFMEERMFSAYVKRLLG